MNNPGSPNPLLIPRACADVEQFNGSVLVAKDDAVLVSQGYGWANVLGEAYKLPKQRSAAKVDPKIYDEYAGKYAIVPQFVLTFTREGDRLMVQATGQPKFEVFPESETEFFLKVVDAQLTFVRDDDGKVARVVLRQGGRDQEAKRLDDEPPK